MFFPIIISRVHTFDLEMKLVVFDKSHIQRRPKHSNIITATTTTYTYTPFSTGYPRSATTMFPKLPATLLCLSTAFLQLTSGTSFHLPSHSSESPPRLTSTVNSCDELSGKLLADRYAL